MICCADHLNSNLQQMHHLVKFRVEMGSTHISAEDSHDFLIESLCLKLSLADRTMIAKDVFNVCEWLR